MHDDGLGFYRIKYEIVLDGKITISIRSFTQFSNHAYAGNSATGN
jgi:hypothetical protein